MFASKREPVAGGLKDLIQRVDELDNFSVRVGWFPSSRHPTEDGGTIPMATIAVKNEFGAPPVPPRPFVRPALANNRDEWRETIKRGARAVIYGSLSDDQLMEAIGLSVAGHIRASIASVTSPPLSQRTIAARLAVRADKSTVGSLTKPLVFEGLLLNSVSYAVRDEPPVAPFG